MISACWRWLLLLAGFGVFVSVAAAPVSQRKEGHGFYNEANVAELYQKIDAFVAATIGPGATAAPAK